MLTGNFLAVNIVPLPEASIGPLLDRCTNLKFHYDTHELDGQRACLLLIEEEMTRLHQGQCTTLPSDGACSGWWAQHLSVNGLHGCFGAGNSSQAFVRLVVANKILGTVPKD